MACLALPRSTSGLPVIRVEIANAKDTSRVETDGLPGEYFCGIPSQLAKPSGWRTARVAPRNDSLFPARVHRK